MIDHKHKFIFVHIPKTAGESIEISLDGHGKKENLWGYENRIVLQHLRAIQIQEKVGDEIFKSYFKFSFVRNPFSKCVSEYFWEKSFLKESLSFCDWVKLKLSDLIKKSENNKKKMRQKHNLEQYKFLYNVQGELIVDFIGKFENLDKDFDLICDRIGIEKKQLPHRKQYKKHKQDNHYTEYYDDETRSIVEEKYAKDIEYFGYKFGE